MSTRKCSKCEKSKPLDEFGKGRGQCKPCRKSLQQQRISRREGSKWECTECHQVKQSSDFYEGRRVCKDCVSKANIERRIEDPDWAESNRQQKRESYSNNPEPARKKSRDHWAQTPRPCVFCEEDKIQIEFIPNRQICKDCSDSSSLKCKSCKEIKPREYFVDLRDSFSCRNCRNANTRQWQAENPNRVKAAQKKHQSTPEYRAKKNKRQKEKYANRPDIREKIIERNLIRKFGITLAEYELKKLEQGSRCAICGCEGELELDHNHATDQVRDFLCSGCNSGIGQMQEDTERIVQCHQILATT